MQSEKLRIMDAENKEKLKMTLEKGFVLQAIVFQFKNETGRYPDFGEWTNMAYGFYYNVWPEVMPYGGSDYVTSAFDGRGGWQYDLTNGLVLLNSKENFVTENKPSFALTNIVFWPHPNVPHYTLQELGFNDADFTDFEKVIQQDVDTYVKTGKVSFKVN